MASGHAASSGNIHVVLCAFVRSGISCGIPVGFVKPTAAPHAVGSRIRPRDDARGGVSSPGWRDSMRPPELKQQYDFGRILAALTTSGLRASIPVASRRGILESSKGGHTTKVQLASDASRAVACEHPSSLSKRRIHVNPARVMIVDSHQIFAEGLAHLLLKRFDVIGTIGDVRLLVAAASRLRPDVILLDTSVHGIGGLEALQRLKEHRLSPRVIILTTDDGAQVAARALKAGAAGVLLKTSSTAELFVAIDAALQGRTYLTPTLTRDVLSLISSPTGSAGVRLTARRQEVLRMIVRGQRVKEIATALELSPRSVESIKYQLMQEMKVHSTASLVRCALQHQLVLM